MFGWSISARACALGFEAGDHVFGVHPQLDDFEGNAAANGFFLLGHINHPATAFADFLQEFVAPNVVAGLFGRRRGNDEGATGRGRRRFQERIGTLVGLEEGREPGAKCLVPRAGLVEVGFALRAFGPLAGLSEEDVFPLVIRFHRRRRWGLHLYMRIPAGKSMAESQTFFSPPSPA